MEGYKTVNDTEKTVIINNFIEGCINYDIHEKEKEYRDAVITLIINTICWYQEKGEGELNETKRLIAHQLNEILNDVGTLHLNNIIEKIVLKCTKKFSDEDLQILHKLI
jgi:hypothetical protein